MAGRVLPVRFFERPADTVARELLGKAVRSTVGGELTAGRIVEAEAYLGAEDPASHAFAMRRHRGNQSIYGAPATWYVYRSYGIHWCLNLVCRGPAAGAAVLIRALEPLQGLPQMALRRGQDDPRQFCSGPGKLTMALGIEGSLDGQAMDARCPVTVIDAPDGEIGATAVTTRIGITKAADWPLRYVLADCPWISRRIAGVRTLRGRSPG